MWKHSPNGPGQDIRQLEGWRIDGLQVVQKEDMSNIGIQQEASKTLCVFVWY